MRSGIKRLAIGLALLVVSACDPSLPLYLRNGCAEYITVKTFFTDGTVSEGALEPGQRLAYMHVPRNVDIEKVTVFLKGAVIHTLDRAKLTSMLSSVKDPRHITWNIEEHGIRPLSATELRD